MTTSFLMWRDPNPRIGLTFFTFDAITSLNPEDSVDVTDHTVEDGAPVTDNARSLPGTLSIEAVMSMVPKASDSDAAVGEISLNVPLRNPGGAITFPLDIPPVPVQFSETGLINAGIGALSNALFGGPKATATGPSVPKTVQYTVLALQQTTPRNRVREAYDILLKLKDDHFLVDVITLHRDYRGLMVTRLAAPRTTADGTSIKFQIDLKAVRFASSKSVTAPKPAEPRAQPISDKGKQGAKPDLTPDQKTSLLKNFSLKLTGF